MRPARVVPIVPAGRLDRDCPRPSAPGRSKTARDAGVMEELRAASRRIRALSRRLAQLDDHRRAAAQELKDELEQVLIGLDLLERRPPSEAVAAFAAKLRRAALDLRRTLNRRR